MDETQFQYFNEKLKNIKNSSNKGKDDFIKEFEELSVKEKRDFFNKRKRDELLNSPYKETFKPPSGQKDKIVLFEYSQLDREFDIQMMFLLMIEYFEDRMKTFSYENDEQKKGAEFLFNKLFNHKESNCLDTIYDVFLKDEKRVNPAFIPKIKEDEFGNKKILTPKGKSLVLPSFSQYKNAYNFCTNKIDEGRIFTQAVFGTLPSTELMFRVHGVFNNTDEMNKYRLKNANLIQDVCYPIKIGYTVLADSFKANKEGIIIYNSADPDLEMMIQNQHNIKKAEAKMIKSKLSKIESDKIPKDVQENIRKYKRAQDKGNKYIKEAIESSNIDKKDIIETEAGIYEAEKLISQELDQVLDSNDLRIDGFKIKRGRIEKKTEYFGKLEDL